MSIIRDGTKEYNIAFLLKIANEQHVSENKKKLQVTESKTTKRQERNLMERFF